MKARRHDEPRRVDDLGIVAFDPRIDAGYSPILDQQVGDLVQALRWVDYAPAAHQYGPCVSH